jgi:hypothetical protein
MCWGWQGSELHELCTVLQPLPFNRQPNSDQGLVHVGAILMVVALCNCLFYYLRAW